LQIVLSSDGPTSLPTGKAVTIFALLSGYVEISQPATSRDLRALLKGSTSNNTIQALEELVVNHAEMVMAKRLSALDVLEQYPDIEVPFSVRSLDFSAYTLD
jgi:cytochrome P450/NADPH-cytochrome P450 reductase